MTKLLVSSLMLATLLAAPALAASRAAQQVQAQRGYGAYAAARGPAIAAPRAANGTAVVFGNRVVGQDPDANIRAQIQHDPVPNEY